MITREVIQNIPLYTVIKEMMKIWYHIIHGCQEGDTDMYSIT